MSDVQRYSRFKTKKKHLITSDKCVSPFVKIKAETFEVFCVYNKNVILLIMWRVSLRHSCVLIPYVEKVLFILSTLSVAFDVDFLLYSLIFRICILEVCIT